MPTPTTADTTGTVPEQWISRADLAALMDCSGDTVRRAQHRHELQTRSDPTGRVLLNVADFVRIGLLKPAELRTGATPAESAQLVRARDAVAALSAQVAELTGRLAQADLVRDTLREQLTVKDRQITQQANALIALIGRLGTPGGAA